MNEKILTVKCPETGMTRLEVLKAAFGFVQEGIRFNGKAYATEVLYPGDVHTHTGFHGEGYRIELVGEDDGLDTTFFWKPTKTTVKA